MSYEVRVTISLSMTRALVLFVRLWLVSARKKSSILQKSGASKIGCTWDRNGE